MITIKNLGKFQILKIGREDTLILKIEKVSEFRRCIKKCAESFSSIQRI